MRLRAGECHTERQAPGRWPTRPRLARPRGVVDQGARLPGAVIAGSVMASSPMPSAPSTIAYLESLGVAGAWVTRRSGLPQLSYGLARARQVFGFILPPVKTATAMTAAAAATPVCISLHQEDRSERSQLGQRISLACNVLPHLQLVAGSVNSVTPRV